MSLSSGAQLGPYEILALIGAGGMGEVYRARDTKLQRDVAIKVLPDLFANDPERLARFKRGAQVLASLNHPNIAHIPGLEDANGIYALAMELVEDPTLADRIVHGPTQAPMRFGSHYNSGATNQEGSQTSHCTRSRQLRQICTSSISEEGVKMQVVRMKVAPDTVAYADAEHDKLIVEFAIPGAPTETIDVKILEDSVHLLAPARDIEYVTALALGWPVKPDKAEASYENGLLRIEVPFKDPMEDAVKVAIKAGGAETKTKSIEP